MSSDSKTVYWLGSTQEKKATEELRAAARKAGFRSEWVVLDDKVDFSQPNWVEENLPGVISAILWAGGTPQRLTQFLKVFRVDGPSRVILPPVFAGAADDKADLLSDLAALAVDDVFLYSGSESFARRLSVRCRSALERRRSTL